MESIPNWIIATFGSLFGVLLSVMVYFFKRMYDKLETISNKISDTRLYAANTFVKNTTCNNTHIDDKQEVKAISDKVSAHENRITTLEEWKRIIDK